MIFNFIKNSVYPYLTDTMTLNAFAFTAIVSTWVVLALQRNPTCKLQQCFGENIFLYYDSEYLFISVIQVSNMVINGFRHLNTYIMHHEHLT